MKSININSFSIVAGFLMIFGGISCTPDDEELGLGPKAEAAFTITDISTQNSKNTYVLQSTTEKGFSYKWNLGNGNEFVGEATDTVTYDDRGTYEVTLTVLSAGGYSTATQTVDVANDAVTGSSAVSGGDMENEEAWSFTASGNTEINYTFSDGALNVTNGNPAQSTLAIWQAVELKGGRAYQFDASVKGSGMTNSWLEVILLQDEPEEGSDPSGDVFTGLNTWTGCGNDAFDTTLGELSCLGDGKVNIATDGTYYLVIKTGSWDGNLGENGLWLDDIQFVAQPRLLEGDNILEGSDMENPAAWTVTDMGMALTDVEFTDGVMKFSNGTSSVQTNVGVWQAVDVTAGQIYKFKALVNNAGATGSWNEYYVSGTAPEDGVDYTTGRIEIGNTTSFSDSGTVYVLIKVGSWDGNLGADGVTVDDVELVEMN
ncbi:hypothetical protein GCM10027429_27980 [Marivirga atlantica]|jgi:hypothetical protein|uniref:PKD domain-containing protein n=1 Tax=Marivirga atlantica TaxID=1548457 RepID=A0A937DJX0_9BACT|nr:PKD domain-containing protein [Marivirga atlantica]MBL0766400.1 hypothetical protein [Marivirga atlantica]